MSSRFNNFISGAQKVAVGLVGCVFAGFLILSTGLRIVAQFSDDAQNDDQTVIQNKVYDLGTDDNGNHLKARFIDRNIENGDIFEIFKMKKQDTLEAVFILHAADLDSAQVNKVIQGLRNNVENLNDQHLKEQLILRDEFSL